MDPYCGRGTPNIRNDFQILAARIMHLDSAVTVHYREDNVYKDNTKSFNL